MGELTVWSGCPRKRAMRISIFWTRRGSWEQRSSHQSGNIARWMKSRIKPALESRRIRATNERRMLGLVTVVVVSDRDSGSSDNDTTVLRGWAKEMRGGPGARSC